MYVLVIMCEVFFSLFFVSFCKKYGRWIGGGWDEGVARGLFLFRFGLWIIEDSRVWSRVE